MKDSSQKLPSPLIHTIAFLLLIPLVVASVTVLYGVSTVELDSRGEIANYTPDTAISVDTIPLLGDGYTALLRSSYMLNLAEETVSIPMYEIVSEDGVVGSVAGIFTDMTAEQYACFDVIVKAGIETGEIQIMTDCTAFNEDRTVAEMTVALPAPEITISYIDYSTTRFHFDEGHVTDTAEITLAFIKNAAKDALYDGVQEAINNGILDEARTSGSSQIATLLNSVGVENVRIIFKDSENYLALAGEEGE